METTSTENRFWNKVRKGLENDCWFWLGRIDGKGYGKFRLNGKEYGTHRIALKLSGIDITDKFVLHKCDTPLCVNPNHLKAGTHQENMAEMKAKGRARNKHTAKTNPNNPLPYYDKIHVCESCGNHKRERIFIENKDALQTAESQESTPILRN